MLAKAPELKAAMQILRTEKALVLDQSAWDILLQRLRDYQDARGGEVHIFPRRVNNLIDPGPFGEGQKYFLLKGRPVFIQE